MFLFKRETPLRAQRTRETFIDERAVNGAGFRMIAGPGFAMRFIHEEPGGESHEAEANLAPLAGAQDLRFFLRWAPGRVALDVFSSERPGIAAKGCSPDWEEPEPSRG